MCPPCFYYWLMRNKTYNAIWRWPSNIWDSYTLKSINCVNRKAKRHTDSIEKEGSNSCLAGKEIILKYKIYYHHCVLVQLFVFTWNSEWLQMVGKRETVLQVSHLQNDKKQDGRSANICLSILLLVITTGWIGQVNFGTEVTYNIF